MSYTFATYTINQANPVDSMIEPMILTVSSTAPKGQKVSFSVRGHLRNVLDEVWPKDQGQLVSQFTLQVDASGHPTPASIDHMDPGLWPRLCMITGRATIPRCQSVHAGGTSCEDTYQMVEYRNQGDPPYPTLYITVGPETVPGVSMMLDGAQCQRLASLWPRDDEGEALPLTVHVNTEGTPTSTSLGTMHPDVWEELGTFTRGKLLK